MTSCPQCHNDIVDAIGLDGGCNSPEFDAASPGSFEILGFCSRPCLLAYYETQCACGKGCEKTDWNVSQAIRMRAEFAAESP